jgi:hypothetical protein
VERVNASRQRVLVATVVAVGAALGGCLTLDPSVTANTSASSVFEDVTVNEPWASGRVRSTATLSSSPDAGDVTQITVVTESGETFSTAATDPGQTSVILELPANRNATLVASDTVNGTTIETLNVTTGGDEVV